MYVDASKSVQGGRVYWRYLLRESYREHGKVKKRTIANLSRCSAAEVEAIKVGLQRKDDPASLGTVEDVQTSQGFPVGAVLALAAVAKRLGLPAALGADQAGKLALWQVLARLIDQGSRLSAVRLAASHAACDLLGLETFHEDHLYQNLAWLAEHQEGIERRLFARRYGSAPPQLFLYDVTSTYLEGVENVLGAFGYNRDGKRGKQQLVIGLLTGPDGAPVAVRVFAGNTQDPKTVDAQVRLLAESFGVREVTLVGDRGMLKTPQQELLNGVGFHYITAITKPQIRGLLRRGVLQLGLFEDTLGEVCGETGRYVLRRNPARAEETAASRADKLATIQELLERRNQYLAGHPRAKIETADKTVTQAAARLRIAAWVQVVKRERRLLLEVDEAARGQEAELDGCYALLTDLKPEQDAAQLIHDRYKDLAEVEQAFRTCKLSHLELRPVFVRNEASTRGHVFVVMLAYLVRRELAAAWGALNLKVNEGINTLDALSSTVVELAGASVHQIPRPTGQTKQLLDALHITLPTIMVERQVIVATRKNLADERKAK